VFIDRHERLTRKTLSKFALGRLCCQLASGLSRHELVWGVLEWVAPQHFRFSDRRPQREDYLSLVYERAKHLTDVWKVWISGYNRSMKKGQPRVVTLTKSSLAESSDHGYMDGTHVERLNFACALSEEVWSLIPNQNVERRLQRDVAVLVRRERAVLARGRVCDGRTRLPSCDEGH